MQIILAIICGVICAELFLQALLYSWWILWGKEAEEKETARLKKKYGWRAITTITM